MKCKICGSEVAEGLRFCNECGAEVEMPKVAEPAPVVDPAPNPESAPEQSQPEQPQKNPGKGLGIAALIIGIASWLVLSPLYCGCSFMSLGFIPAILEIILGVVGLILAIIGMKKSKAVGMKNVMAVIGLILGILHIVGGVAMIVISILVVVLGAGTGILAGLAESFGGSYGGGYYY